MADLAEGREIGRIIIILRPGNSLKTMEEYIRAEYVCFTYGRAAAY